MFCKGLQRDGRDRFHCLIVIEDPPDRNRLSCRRCRYRDSGIGIGPPPPDPLRLWNGLAGAREQLRRRSGGASWPSMGWGCLSGSRVTSDDWRAWPGDADVQKPSLQRSFCGLRGRGGARCKAAGRSHPMSAGAFDGYFRQAGATVGKCRSLLRMVVHARSGPDAGAGVSPGGRRDRGGADRVSMADPWTPMRLARRLSR